MQTTGGITFTSGIQFTPWVAPGLQGTYSFRITNPNATGSSASDGFGGVKTIAGAYTNGGSKAIDISSSYILVGAAGDRNAANNESAGKAYLFNLSNGSLKYTLSNSNIETKDFFGTAVALTNNYSVVGVPEFRGGMAQQKIGNVYIFSNSTGSLVARVAQPNINLGARFGRSVAATDTYTIVGAPDRSRNTSGAGEAYIFYTANGALQYTIQTPWPAGGYNFGTAVAINQTHFVVATGGGGQSARFYRLSDSALVYTLDLGGANTNGVCTDMSDSYTIVGIPSFNSGGRARIFSNATGNVLFTLQAPSINSSEQFGYTVSISETYALVGSQLANGNVYMFSTSTGNLVKTFKNTNDPNPPGTSDYFGSGVKLNGYNMVIAAPGDNSDSGAVFVYN